MYFNGVVIFLLTISSCFGYRPAFDEDLYNDVLDTELCDTQLNILLNSNSPLGLIFLDASGKLPNGMASLNFNDLGDYYQCLGIDQVLNGSRIEGKYSGIILPWNQELPSLPEVPFPPELPNITLPTPPSPPIEETRHRQEFRNLQHWAQMMAGVEKPLPAENQEVNGRVFPLTITLRSGALLGVCIPKPCTATQAVNFFQSQVPLVDFTFVEFYYRLPQDKPYAAADYVAIVLFSLIGCFVVACTSYDLYCKFAIKCRPNKLMCCFSVYTNTRRLLTFNTIPNALECVDGIRAISMLWVVVGHTYSLTLLGFVHNINDTLEWLRLFTSTWVNSAPLTVDTFFLLSGILAVYSTIGKISQARFIRTIHLFYINRLLRMFPLLATVILLQASVFNYVSDGPFWLNVANAAENCRTYWWSALLHVQNYVNPLEICLAQTWYLSVDTQLYLVCPVVLVWMFGARRFAWAALCLMLVLSLVSSSVYSFIYQFSAALVQPNRIDEFADYLQTYYINTLTRAPPFFVGMIYGYLLHLYRGQKVEISKVLVTVLWLTTAALMAFCVFSIYPVMQLDWDTQPFDNFLNAYMRTLWALAVGWLIFGCVHGYGGPVNWFLSLTMWKLPARISFAMYLIHFPIMMIANGSWTSTHYFRNGDNMYRFMADLMLTFIAAFTLCITIDAPFSTIQKLLMGGGKRPPVKGKSESQEPIDTEKTSL